LVFGRQYEIEILAEGRLLSRSKRFMSGLVFGYTNQVATMLVGLWLTPFLLHHLGQAGYGLWLTALPILNYLMLADFGIVALLPRTVAYATGRAGGDKKNATDLPATLGQTAVVVLWQTPLVALVAALVWVFLPKEWIGLRGPLGLTMGVFAALFPTRMFAAVLEGLQEQSFVVRASMLSWAAGTVCSVLMILAGFGLYSVAVGWLFILVGSAVACAYRLWTHHREVLPSRLPRLSRPELMGQLGRGFWISANQVGQILMASTDVLIISKMLGPVMVVPYVCTGKLANTLANQPQMLMNMAMPGLSEMRTGESKERLYQVSVALSQGMLLLTGLLFCVILAINKSFVHWWVGPKEYGGFTLTWLILLQMLMRHWNLTIAYTAFCFGHEKMLAISGFLDGLVTAGAMLLLVRHFGYAGVVTGSIIGVCLTTLPSNLITVARELRLSPFRLLAPFWPWFWRCGLVAGGCAMFARTWTPVSPLQMMAVGAVVALVYCAVLLRPILASPLGPYLQRGTRGARNRYPRLMDAILHVEKAAP
jgi:O-antigen/teichoic acid export membrane protein